MDPWSTPTCIGSLYLANEFSKLFVDAGPADASTFPGPMPSKTVPIPPDYGVRVQSDQHLPPALDKAGEDDPKEAIPSRWTDPVRARFHHRQLLSKGEIFQGEFMP